MDVGYVLHRRRYRESSLIVDLLTRDRGRVSAVARGAVRKQSRLGGALQPLCQLRLSLAGRSELMTLAVAEPQAQAIRIIGRRLYAALYLNELVMRLTATHDPNLNLYSAYEAALEELRQNVHIERLLRRFEKRMLDALGLGLVLDFEAGGGGAVEPDKDYVYELHRGPVVARDPNAEPRLLGATMLALARETDLTDQQLRQAKTLMRFVIRHYLDGHPLRSRKLFEQ